MSRLEEKSEKCVICGEALEPNQAEHDLCSRCEDDWRRDEEATW